MWINGQFWKYVPIISIECSDGRSWWLVGVGQNVQRTISRNAFPFIYSRDFNRLFQCRKILLLKNHPKVIDLPFVNIFRYTSITDPERAHLIYTIEWTSLYFLPLLKNKSSLFLAHKPQNSNNKKKK